MLENEIEELLADNGILSKDVAQLKAKKTKQLLEKTANLKATVEEKESLEAYLVKIEPGCDFITLNIGSRKTNRQTEKDALGNAKATLKGSPAFKEFMAEAHAESLGKCKAICLPPNDEDHVDCKACLADVSNPGYCAGHPGTTGC